ncbi:PEP-CTERM sorting domain-containing protein [Pelomonas sp. P7]|uniref:PEP-CTERM sorting domain-containing protein n=1 Tax=Pelomonas caseinilytica TaxID=2906763 RepID=A0ABS8XA95_9BURK|nr:PEP-CTERM sorting domain-containing protein [Pelomonas sp. P7]MCE4535857.1 PEP-CTERM sorting domain-containing protein [Pelomonas sp. P7]
MPALRPASLVLGLLTAATLAAAPARADTPLPLGTPGLPNLYGLELNQWFVFANQASAGTSIDGKLTQEGGLQPFPLGSELSREVQTSQASGSKLASAFARVSATGVGASASARDPLDPASTWTGSVGYAMVSYAAVLDRDTSIRFDLKLDGQLRTLGERATGPDASGAAVAALAYGSQADMTDESQRAVFAAAGLSPDASEEVLLQQLSTLKSSTQTHLDAFGAQADTAHPWTDVDTTLHVTAQGTEVKCDGSFSSPACGRYFYLFNVLLFTGAQNGGLADFSHSLQVSAISVDGGAALPFQAVSAVPEPSTALLWAAGVCGLLVRRRLR